jgi:hypothetical protein
MRKFMSDQQKIRQERRRRQQADAGARLKAINTGRTRAMREAEKAEIAAYLARVSTNS